MAEEVVIKVREERSGTALRDAAVDVAKLKQEARAAAEAANPQTVQRRDELYKAASAYESKGHFDLAKSARADAQVYEKDITRDTQERYEVARALIRDKRQSAKEDREDAKEAVKAAREVASVGKIALNVGGRAAGASGMGGIASMIGAVGPQALAAAAVAELVGSYVSQWKDKQDEQARQRGEGIRQAHRQEFIHGLTGGEGQERAGAEAERLREEIIELKEKKGSFVQQGWSDMAKNGYNNTLGRVLPTLERSDVKAERENGETLSRKEGELEKAKAEAAEKYTHGPGGWDLEARQKILDGDIKGAIALRDRAAAEKEYQTVLKATGHNTELAEQAAELTVKEAARGRAMSLGHLVNARSGAGDISRLASLASQESTGDASPAAIINELRAMHETQKTQHAEAINNRPHRI